jgi:predicted small secreted protein
LFGSSSAIIYKNFKKDQIMKRTLVLTFSFLTMATFMAGCGQMPSFGSSTTATAEECETLNKKLIKVDDFSLQLQENHQP